MLRFGIPYGPRARAAGVVAKFIDLALDGKALTIAGDGSQSRRFVYVEDLAEGIVAALATEAADRAYNLSSDENMTIMEIAETVQELTGDCEIVHTRRDPATSPARRSPTSGAEELGGRRRRGSARECAATSSGSAAAPAARSGAGQAAVAATATDHARRRPAGRRAERARSARRGC